MTSVLLEMSMFPTDHGESKSEYVSRIIKMIDESGYPYQLTPMSTIIEFDSIDDALDIIKKSYETLEVDSDRVYSTIKFDIRKNKSNRLKQKIESIEKRIGEVKK
jgi:uncharacterized protein (TIGR00106 family)